MDLEKCKYQEHNENKIKKILSVILIMMNNLVNCRLPVKKVFLSQKVEAMEVVDFGQ